MGAERGPKTWTLHLRNTVKWHNGRQMIADHVVWNMKRWLDPTVGSSVLGLLKGFILEDVDSGQKDDNGNPKMTTACGTPTRSRRSTTSPYG